MTVSKLQRHVADAVTVNDACPPRLSQLHKSSILFIPQPSPLSTHLNGPSCFESISEYVAIVAHDVEHPLTVVATGATVPPVSQSVSLHIYSVSRL